MLHAIEKEEKHARREDTPEFRLRRRLYGLYDVLAPAQDGKQPKCRRTVSRGRTSGQTHPRRPVLGPLGMGREHGAGPHGRSIEKGQNAYVSVVRRRPLGRPLRRQGAYPQTHTQGNPLPGG